jgi:hypothetical protein
MNRTQRISVWYIDVFEGGVVPTGIGFTIGTVFAAVSYNDLTYYLAGIGVMVSVWLLMYLFALHQRREYYIGRHVPDED